MFKRVRWKIERTFYFMPCFIFAVIAFTFIGILVFTVIKVFGEEKVSKDEAEMIRVWSDEKKMERCLEKITNDEYLKEEGMELERFLK